MIRTILYLLASVFVLALVRGMIGIITKGVGELFKEESSRSKASPRPSAPGSSGFGGELVKCPACGVFHSQSTGVKVAGKDSTLYFCSQGCRDKHPA